MPHSARLITFDGEDKDGPGLRLDNVFLFLKERLMTFKEVSLGIALTVGIEAVLFGPMLWVRLVGG